MQIRKTNKYQITFRCINYQSWIKKTNRITFSTVYQLLRARTFWDNQVKVSNKKYRNATLPSKFLRPRYLKKFTDKYNFISSIFRRSDKNSIITYRTASAWNVCKKGKMKIYARFHPQLLQNGCKIRPAVILVLRRNGAWREGWKLFFEYPNKQEGCNKQTGALVTFPRYQMPNPLYLCPFGFLNFAGTYCKIWKNILVFHNTFQD